MGKKKRKAGKVVFDPLTDTGMDEPVRVRIAARDVNDRFSTYPSVGLNPVRLASILREANDGNVRRQMELFEEIYRVNDTERICKYADQYSASENPKNQCGI